jgi:hypothetical protein
MGFNLHGAFHFCVDIRMSLFIENALPHLSLTGLKEVRINFLGVYIY